MKCIIVDDDPLALRALRQMISQVDYLELVQEFSNATDALNFLSTETIDLVILDVEMPGMTGLELIKNLEKRPIIILTSSKKEYAIDGFDLNVADYLAKPVELPRFLAAIARAKEFFDSNNQSLEISGKEKDSIFIRSNSLLTRIEVKDILYIQALGDYVNIYTTDKRHTVHITLRAIETKFPPGMFFRLHRSYLIAVNRIESIEENTAYIGKHPIPIGMSYKKNLLEKLNLI
ncbi:MAG TPA: LytTR family DNA-binding domain-containing protein [Bacteroidia bacterium]|jgi:DNA-binding LytR/AlgR family response regulator|nr:LytTR family DNA-binding domain-containing protein [Bacteroidia bacterium]